VQGKGLSPAIFGSEGKIKGSSPPLKERSDVARSSRARGTLETVMSGWWKAGEQERATPKGCRGRDLRKAGNILPPLNSGIDKSKYSGNGDAFR